MVIEGNRALARVVGRLCEVCGNPLVRVLASRADFDNRSRYRLSVSWILRFFKIIRME